MSSSNVENRATIHVGPKGGVEYRLWTEADTFRVVGKYKALPHMSPEEKDKAERMEADRKAKKNAQFELDSAFRSMRVGR